MDIVKSQTNLIDTAIGPVAITESEVLGFGIEDYVHTAVRSQALKLQLKLKLSQADKRFTSNRYPVDIDGVRVGGF